MLSAGRITREELYEAVWSESVQKLAMALGISDVGLAKICKKLNVPRPGRGYWAKPRGARKVLRVSLPPLKPGQDESYVISSPDVEGGAGWTREALQHLAGEGLTVPTVLPSGPTTADHPLIATYRELLVEHGLETSLVWPRQACLAVSVSPGQLERSLEIVRKVFEAFEKQGYQPEVLPPNPHGRNCYGVSQVTAWSPIRSTRRRKSLSPSSKTLLRASSPHTLFMAIGPSVGKSANSPYGTRWPTYVASVLTPLGGTLSKISLTNPLYSAFASFCTRGFFGLSNTPITY